MAEYCDKELENDLIFISEIKIMVAGDEKLKDIPIMARSDEPPISLDEDEKRVLFSYC